MTLTEAFHYFNSTKPTPRKFSHFEPTWEDEKHRKMIQREKRKRKKRLKELFD